MFHRFSSTNISRSCYKVSAITSRRIWEVWHRSWYLSRVKYQITERWKRGISAKVLIGSFRSRLSRDINKFMLNNNNKISLISWFCTLDTEKIILSGDDKCIAVTYDSTEDNVDLKSNQEEAGTKVILHSMNVIRSGGDAAICSPSGDTDIMVLVLAWYHGIPLLEMITFQPSFVRGKTLLVNNEK